MRISSVLATIEVQIWWKKLQVAILSRQGVSQPWRAIETGVFGNSVAWNQWNHRSWNERSYLFPTCRVNPKKLLKLVHLAILWLGTKENTALDDRSHLFQHEGPDPKSIWNFRVWQNYFVAWIMCGRSDCLSFQELCFHLLETTLLSNARVSGLFCGLDHV